MRFLITGGAGFVGSHLADAVVARGDEALVLDDLSSGSAANLANAIATGRCELVVGDARDKALVEGLVARSDAVFHLAASVGVRLFAQEPVHTISNNASAAEVVLLAASKRGVPTLFTSSSEVYGGTREVPFREDAPLVLPPTERPRGAYATSKLLGEALALACVRERGARIVVARLFNVAGARQRVEQGMVLPRFLAQARAGEPLTIYGDGRQTRCFTHVEDTVAALLSLLLCPDARGQVVNVGSAEEIGILELAELVRAVTRSRSTLRFVPFAEAIGGGLEDPPRRVPHLGRLERLVGAVPRTKVATLVARLYADAGAAAVTAP